MANAPYFVAGSGRFDTRVMAQLGERVFCKVGAEGVYCAALPEAVLRVMPAHEPEVALAMERAKLRSKPLDPGMITLQDMKDFLLAYCACFLAVLAFIS